MSFSALNSIRELLTPSAIGFVSGLLSGAFGIGGGIITTPGIRLLLGAPALVAVGTPLPVIFPSAITGSINYYKNNQLDTRVGLWCGVFGSLFAVVGAIATRWAGGTIVLLATSALILYTAADMILQVIRPPRVGLEGAEERDAFAEADAAPMPGDAPDSAAELAARASRVPDASPVARAAAAPIPLTRLALIGGLTGLYSGFLGLGGGFVLVPLLTRWLHFDIKRSIGTSLMAIAILAVPGTITHALMGHVDWRIALLLAIGVVPGAWIGSRITLGSSDRATRIGFAVMLVLVGVWLGASELGWLPS